MRNIALCHSPESGDPEENIPVFTGRTAKIEFTNKLKVIK